MFRAALFTIAKTWKHPKCPYRRMDKDVVHKHNGILLSHKENEIMPFAATWMDSEMIILSEVRERERQMPYSIIFVEIQNMAPVNLSTNRLTDTENRLVVAQGWGGESGRAMGWELGLADANYCTYSG